MGVGRFQVEVVVGVGLSGSLTGYPYQGLMILFTAGHGPRTGPGSADDCPALADSTTFPRFSMIGEGGVAVGMA